MRNRCLGQWLRPVLSHRCSSLPSVKQAACTHALGCPRCRLVRARYETLRRALRVWVSSARPEMTLSPALVESLRARVADCSWMFVRGVPGTPQFRGHHYLTLDVKFWPG